MINLTGHETLLAMAAAIVLALVHLSAGRFRLDQRVPRSRWLSFAGGVSVAYVFIHMLPEIDESARTLEHHGETFAFADQYGYLLALFGFVVFYGLERLVRRGPAGTGPADTGFAGTGPADTGSSSTGFVDTEVADRLFWIHLGSFAIYNAMIGYLVLDRELGGLPAYVVAMGLHFIVIDAGLRHHHGGTYDRWGRWVLAAAVAVGFAFGFVLDDVEVFFAVFVPFLSGGVVLNVLKDELPADRESRFWAFATGALGYAVLLLYV